MGQPLAQDQYIAALGLGQAIETAKQGGFATAGHPDYHQAGARGHLEAHVTQHLLAAIAEADIFGDDGRLI